MSKQFKKTIELEKVKANKEAREERLHVYEEKMKEMLERAKKKEENK